MKKAEIVLRKQLRKLGLKGKKLEAELRGLGLKPVEAVSKVVSKLKKK